MPQIFVMLSPKAQPVVNAAMCSKIDRLLTDTVAELWEVPRDDIAFSVAHLTYTRGEADVQIEYRYTAGKDEYDRGQPFDPSEGKQKLLVDATLAGTIWLNEHGLTCSAWTKPFYKSEFLSHTSF